jgi:RimJ/RimL family protein N-acetyltransferase
MAVADVIEEIFERKLLRRLVARVRLDNWASMKILKRLGFMPEGILRDELLFGGRIVDMVCFGLLSNEWPRGNSSKFKLSPGSPSLP